MRYAAARSAKVHAAAALQFAVLTVVQHLSRTSDSSSLGRENEGIQGDATCSAPSSTLVYAISYVPIACTTARHPGVAHVPCAGTGSVTEKLPADSAAGADKRCMPFISML